MMNPSKTMRRWVSAGLAGVFFLGLVSLGLFAFSTHAQAQDTEQVQAIGEVAAGAAKSSCLTAGYTPAVCPAEGIKDALSTVGEKIISPNFRVAVVKAVLNLSQFVLNRLAYEAAVAISSGGAGQESLFYQTTPTEAVAKVAGLAAGEAVGQLTELTSEELGIEFNLCDPGATSPLLRLQLALSIQQQYQPEAPKCDILEVGANWNGYINTVFSTVSDPDAQQDAILSKFAESLEPGKNEITATLRLAIAIDDRIYEEQVLEFLTRDDRDYKPVTDFITGQVTTPAALLEDRFHTATADPNDPDNAGIKPSDLATAGELIGGLALTTASTFTNTLVSSLLNRVYTGLFEPSPEVDPFNIEASAGGGREDAQERFASIVSTTPIALAEYNALSEFVVCPAQGVTNRGLYNCVMDSNFFAAVGRATGQGTAITIQEAIDEGLLNGSWPLISPDDKASNQDPYCYTYGYCHGNLVKLRQARVLPIGWELAAERSPVGNPVTLQEVIDQFDECTAEGAIGSSNSDSAEARYCHLIDPNWVLKYPDTQCRAVANGELRTSSLTPGRNSVCVDSPSCIGEDNDGVCTDGYGYCVREKNVWRFRGDECPEAFASCLSLTDTTSGENVDYLVNTVDYSVCGQDNAGCEWYRTQKYFEDAGTEDTSDDSYVWFADGDDFETADREADVAYNTGSGAASRTTYSYTSDSGETYSYANFAYEDRVYFTHNAETCSEEGAGCTSLYEFDEDLVLNHVQNGSFEDDEDGDGFADAWINLSGSSSAQTLSETSYTGTYAFETDNSTIQQFVPVSSNNFYTFSLQVRADNLKAGVVEAYLFGYDESGDAVDFSGTSSGGDCSQSSAYYLIEMDPSDSDQFEEGEWTSFDCTFTTTSDTAQIEVYLVSPDDVLIDAVQLELGEDASRYTDGYNANPVPAYYKIAPDYLGCSGDETDPAECDDYAQMCTAQDVGCNLYTPEDGDPAVPAIVSSLDSCPSECVGYATFKQEATLYDSEEFPVYFIADSAQQCSDQYVGCDAFTNLDAASGEGEVVEHYTYMRACLSEDMTDDTNARKTGATFFTWEGSDNAGYQLKTWELLESNVTRSTLTFVNSGEVEQDPGSAPCTSWEVTSTDELICRDNSSVLSEIENDDTCDEHDDIFDNPNCREFFDENGNVHYRLFLNTVTVSESCSAYRKDDSTEDDCEDSGGFWNSQGFCRYFGLSEESVSCPAEQNGCRSYTGGTAHNATTILDETFEGGTYADFVAADVTGTATISISNESVATDGLSLRAAASGGYAGFATVQAYLNGTDDSDSFDVDDTAKTCTTFGHSLNSDSTACEIDVDSDGTADCDVEDGESSCGTLADSLVSGKTFSVDFWAKGLGELYVTFEEEGGSGTVHDMVDPTAEISTFSDLTSIELDSSWQLYSLGPLDTSDAESFDENAVLQFVVGDGEELYIDNITLKQLEENVTLIKDSWVVPSTCDQTPDGVDSDQYYLGCEAYTDQNGVGANLYQFSDVCSEEVVGCEGFFDTHESESAYQQVFNARCVYDTDQDLSTEETAESNVDCAIDDETFCTISSGRSYCVFDTDLIFESPLPFEDSGSTTSDGSAISFGVVYGPETRLVAGDEPVYIVTDSSHSCSSAVAGCMEVGLPTYSQDHSEVESFESAYVIDDPSSYDSALCENEALFCEEWSSTQDGNFYFKAPKDKTCEYKTNVSLNNNAYEGWFVSGTSEPCYYDDADGDNEWDSTETAYLIGGEEFGVWRNGDDDYAGWVGVCDSKYDLCTEFIDVVDTNGGISDSTSYYFVNNDLLSEENLADTQKCDGQVSQKFGCALFNNTTDSDLTYNAGASYVVSLHADILVSDTKNSLQNPINCDNDSAGDFTISSSAASDLGLSSTSVDVCEMRCAYELDSGDSLDTLQAEDAGNDDWLERSCLSASDCPTLTTDLGSEVEGSCVNAVSAFGDEYRLSNDTNEVIKVNRDRSCSAWLACESSKPTWNTQTNQYDYICDSIGLCTEGSSRGDYSVCTQWDDTDPEVLTDYKYSLRDVTWTGFEYSGIAIPDQLPVEHYQQRNVYPERVCVYGDNDTSPGSVVENSNGLPTYCEDTVDCSASTTSCSSNADCVADGYGSCESGFCTYACENSGDDDYRLVYDAGSCDATEDGVGNGGECFVGQCSEDGSSCTDDGDCDEECVVGYCVATGDTGCDSTNDAGTCACDPSDNDEGGENDACASASIAGLIDTPYCSPQSECVSLLVANADAEDSCVTASECGNSLFESCQQTATASSGGCYNNRCLTDIRDGEDDDQLADALDVDSARVEECRGYPEIDSPFPSKVVDTWQAHSGTSLDADSGNLSITGYDNSANEDSIETWSTPYNFQNGFQDSNVCGIDQETGELVDCLCSYDKVEYGDGASFRYYEIGTGTTSGVIPQGVCSGGPIPGLPCESDADCSDGTTIGSCTALTRVDAVHGWHGYCLETDTSISINADQDDQACLTWLPVDQLTGATDLYAKYTSAGYAPQDTYYCAEVGVSYEISTTQVACAKSGLNICYDGSWSKFTDKAEPSSSASLCLQNVFCPAGFFAVMGGCGDESPFSGLYCDDSVTKDCPYYCVPKYSYNDDGEACLDPESAGFVELGKAADGDEAYKTSYSEVNHDSSFPLDDDDVDFDIYVIRSTGGTTAWSDLAAYYFGEDGDNLCTTRGVTDSVSEFQEPYDDFADIPNEAGTRRYGWYNFVPRVDAVPACLSLVQVSMDELSSNESDTHEEVLPFETYNAGSTNYLWEDEGTYSITGSSTKYFGYEYLTVNTPFGQSEDPDVLSAAAGPSVAPPIVAMCVADEGIDASVAPADESASCDESDYDWNEYDARAYYDVEIDAGSDNWKTYCKDSDCDCEDSGNGNVDWCNWDDGAAFSCDESTAVCDNDSSTSCSVDADCSSGGTCVSTCNGGPNEGADCETEGEEVCRVNVCHENYGGDTTLDSAYCSNSNALSFDVNENEDPDDAIDRLAQIFGRLYKLVTFTDGYSGVSDVESDDLDHDEDSVFGTFNLLDSDDDDWDEDWVWDRRYDGGDAPEVWSVSDKCEGSKCQEGTKDAISVNNQESGDIEAEGSKRVSVSFFAAADSNQMPIRRMIVDWGDDYSDSDMPWPTGSQSGSDADDNFYKNHRGLDLSFGSQCSSDADEFGKSGSACDDSYVTFIHDYNCTNAKVAALDSCQYDGTRLLNSPCTEDDACVYQPRVHVMDNWGYCTGTCESSNHPDGECFTGYTSADQSSEVDECNIDNCPDEGETGKCESPGTINPWINYDGVVRVAPE